jgi:hypothetical protein
MRLRRNGDMCSQLNLGVRQQHSLYCDDTSTHADVKRQGFSTLLRVTAWYFKLGGVFFAVVTVSGLVSGIVLHFPSTEGMAYPVAMLVVLAASVALLATGVLLARGSRIGGVMALVLTLYPFAFVMWNRRTVSPLELAIAAVTVVAVLLIWRELEWPRNAPSS